MSTKKHDEKEPTGHKHVPGELDQPALGNKDGSMPMGMTGTASGEGDPDQKSTHNAPSTVESNLPDGSPKFMDDESKERERKRKTKAGRYRVLSPIQVATSEPDSVTRRRKSKVYQAGDVVELSQLDAESFTNGEIEPA